MANHTQADSKKRAPEPEPNLEALGLIPPGTLGPVVDPEEARRRLADYYARHPLQPLAPGGMGVVALLKEARGQRGDLVQFSLFA